MIFFVFPMIEQIDRLEYKNLYDWDEARDETGKVAVAGYETFITS